MLKIYQKGFTLIEVMVVVVILGVLAAMIVPNVIGRSEDAKILKAKQDIASLENALEMYRLDNGFYPSTDQGLQALIKKPSNNPEPKSWREGGYIKQLRQDPWGQAYQYLYPGSNREFDVYTPGKPGKQNDENLIGNWEHEDKY